MLWSGGPWYAELTRYAVAMAGCMLLSTNFAFIQRAQDIFPPQTCRFWQMFFVGKSLITAVSLGVLWTASGDVIWWRSGGFLLGYAISLGALLFAYIDRPFEGVPLDQVSPDDHTTVLTQSKEM